MVADLDGNIVSSSIAYPTMGIILLGGISDKQRRYPMHTSAGIAYTGIEEKIRVETSFFVSEDQKGYVNGSPIDGSIDYRSPFTIINSYADKISMKLRMKGDEHVSFSSLNRSVISGSSDGAAAAVGKCIENIIPYDVSLYGIENDLRVISESVGRSIYGGLTITEGNGSAVFTEKILDESAFRDYAVIGCKFSASRRPSDDIHENMVKSPDYPERVSRTKSKGNEIRKLAEDRDIKGIFEMAMADTEEYHRLSESMGVRIITREMRSLMDSVKKARNNVWMSYIVTGGTNVFVPVERKNLVAVLEIAEKHGVQAVPLKVAGGATTI
ncbi:MAG: diphosphomevalonate decarboxylase [Thermoplasmataceae archaeon]